MIHDVMIPFSFDTPPIEAQIASIGEREVAKVIDSVVRQGIADVLPTTYKYDYYAPNKHGRSEVNWHKYVNDYMDKWMERHKQEVIDEAALLIAMRTGRTTQWREVLEELKEERDAQ